MSSKVFTAKVRDFEHSIKMAVATKYAPIICTFTPAAGSDEGDFFSFGSLWCAFLRMRLLFHLLE